MKVDPNAPAFSIPETDQSYYQGGLTKREYIAIELTKALIGTAALCDLAPGDLSGILDTGIEAADVFIHKLNAEPLP